MGQSHLRLANEFDRPSEETIVFLGEDAKRWGVQAAVVISVLRSLTAKNRENSITCHNNYAWCQPVIENFARAIPRFSKRKFLWHIKNLTDEGVLEYLDSREGRRKVFWVRFKDEGPI